LTAADIAGLVAALDGEGKARESIRKSVTAFAMVLDFHGITPNPARDWIQVKLPREDPNEVEPPSAATVEAIGWLLTPAYLLGLLVLDAPACEWGSSRPRVSRTSTRAGRGGLSALPSRRHGGLGEWRTDRRANLTAWRKLAQGLHARYVVDGIGAEPVVNGRGRRRPPGTGRTARSRPRHPPPAT